MSRRILRTMSVALTLVFWASLSLANHDEITSSSTNAERLKTHKIDKTQVTVSGLSSGAFFAHQFHVAHSSLVSGAGIIAGGPYRCADQFRFLPTFLPPATAGALFVCTHYFGSLPFFEPTAEGSLNLLQRALADGAVDSLESVKSHRVWLFHGSRDKVVPREAMDVVKELYERLGVRSGQLVRYKPEPGHSEANHGFPVSDLRNVVLPDVQCGDHKTPFVIRCQYEAAGLMLAHLYPNEFKVAVQNSHDEGTLVAFDQTEFITADTNVTSLGDVGYIYVPNQCLIETCRLHVAFHGCKQNVEAVQDDFVRDAGYNRWAAANKIIVLYPQTKPWFADAFNVSNPANFLTNPNACWDFWGYSGSDYYGKNGKQMKAVRAMLDRIIGH